MRLAHLALSNLVSGKAALAVLVLLCFSPAAVLAGATAPQQQRPRRVAGAGEAPADQSSGGQLDRIKAIESQDERIDLLEKFLVSHRGPEDQAQAREMLMREYSLRGEQYLKGGSVEPAIENFKRVLGAAPREITDRIFDQYIFPLPVAMNTFGFRTESAELMKSFEARFEDNPSRLIQVGFFYVQIEAPLEALRVLERAVHLAPRDHRAHNSLGTAYLINLRLDDAETEFKQALEIDPTDEYANLNVANMLRARGDYEGSLKYFQAQAELKPSDADAHAGMSISLLELGRDEEAEKEIAKAEELGKPDYRFYTQLAYFYATRKKYDLANQMLEKSAAIEPRYAWTFITKAAVDAMEGQFGQALATMIQAQQLGSFPTLDFELAKAFMTLDGYDQATEALTKGFKVTSAGEFEAMLGGVMQARSPRLDTLLSRERRAALFLNIQTTTRFQYDIAEALFLIDHYMNAALQARKAGPGAGGPGLHSAARSRAKLAARRRKGVRPAPQPEEESAETAADSGPAEPGRARRVGSAPAVLQLSAGSDAGLPGMPELLKAIGAFTSLDDGRQVFRMVWVAHKLSDNELALDAAIALAKKAIEDADAATEPANSMRDTPLLDRDGRRAVFLGRAEDALGWALLKKGDTRGAIDHLTRSVTASPDNIERRSFVWHLAVATEQAGDEAHALELYIAGYDSHSPIASVRKQQIERLYKKVNGSLNGLEDRLRDQ
ncbi:MAG TPA: tetratricopeptide repeat protein [Blastocatellia bacterium]|nr:tetratricopeptide repeat protein [Blastocatellia bacterium]